MPGDESRIDPPTPLSVIHGSHTTVLPSDDQLSKAARMSLGLEHGLSQPGDGCGSRLGLREQAKDLFRPGLAPRDGAGPNRGQAPGPARPPAGGTRRMLTFGVRRDMVTASPQTTNNGPRP